METKTEKIGQELSACDLLAVMPYGTGFLFVDEFLEIGRTCIVARYRFRGDEFYYSGHFVDRPVTPGVILLEAMCQSGMVAPGLYLLAQDAGIAAVSRHRFMVTSCEVEWFEQVGPGDLVTMRSELVAWRQRRIRTKVTMTDESGSVIAQAAISGMGVEWNPEAPKDPRSTQSNSERTLTSERNKQ